MTEFAMIHARRIVQMAVWLDIKRLGRGAAPADSSPLELDVRGNQRATNEGGIIQLGARSGWKGASKQAGDAEAILSEVGITHVPPAMREQVLALLAVLERRFGAEGAKRFSESSYVAFRDEHADETMAEFWGSFRTFIEAEYAANRGHPFRVEHFLGDIAIQSDRNGVRIEHITGAGIHQSALQRSFRSKRSDF